MNWHAFWQGFGVGWGACAVTFAVIAGGLLYHDRKTPCDPRR
jgi:hypothetical protein